MKKITAAAAFLTALVASGQTMTEWQNPAVNEINRLPMRTSYFPYESVEAANADKKSDSDRYLSLEGNWKFNWVKDADQRPTDFFKTDYNDSAWGTMPVPGMWQLNGYGDPQYVNIGYPWREQFKNNPPEVPVKDNNVGTYRRTVEIPASWSGKQVIAHFGSATSCIYLWVNGKFVGYSEDSKLDAEFDITRYLHPGTNTIALQMFRWCDGTYVEDQDFFRLSGLARENYLYARDKRHIADIHLTPTLLNGYKSGKLDVDLTVSPAAKGCTAEITLTDPQGRKVATKSVKVKGTDTRSTFELPEVSLWSAETPALYPVEIVLKDAAGKTIEATTLNAGFREVKVAGGQLLVNGKPVLIKGTNRHELDPDGGYVVPVERMIEDIKILKENNFNAVRTCHYPDDPRWYDLCDKYGIYLTAEANIESHGMGYDEKTLAKNPLYKETHLQRNKRNVERNYNHPSVIVWSLGNEAGNGPNFDTCYDWVKAYDPSRPVQYERSDDRKMSSGRNTDIACPMYADYKSCEDYVTSHPTKPLIQCEYAHAMGNSMGGFREYWELIRKYPAYQGGYIWDFVDQSLRKEGKDGVMIYGYGGDWNAYDASDFNFCDNGLISPDRVPNPHMQEVKYWQQPIWTKYLGDGKLSIFNEDFFADLSDHYLRWSVLADGNIVASGIVDDLILAPRTSYPVVLPVGTLPEGEVLLNVEYRLKDAKRLLAPDHLTAYQQFVLQEGEGSDMNVRPAMADRYTSLGDVKILENDRNYIVVESPLVRIDFDRKSGLMTRYDVAGHKILDQGAVLEPNFWRAPTDNDFGAEFNVKNRVWADPGLKLKSLSGKVEGDIAVVEADYALEKVGGELHLTYRINNAGEMSVSEKMTAGSNASGVPDLLRFGMRMRMPKEYDRIDYYGRGPGENYADRKESAMLGRYAQTVDEQFYPYIRQQETGTKSDVRTWFQHNAGRKGIEISAEKPFSASALHYSQESLDEGLAKKQGHSQEVEADDAVWMCIDGAQTGLGCVNSWGAWPLPEYRLPYSDRNFVFKITPKF
ncbi:MAG: DUF4981 domain-containing protein [Bacteroidales bacterium]|nr:DUF4981 domain-containing protein [Bacteroidales bacterium]